MNYVYLIRSEEKTYPSFFALSVPCICSPGPGVFCSTKAFFLVFARPELVLLVYVLSEPVLLVFILPKLVLVAFVLPELVVLLFVKPELDVLVFVLPEFIFAVWRSGQQGGAPQHGLVHRH